ncbi:MAG: hypothetical protein KFH87_08365, partial [Bacteroidetes bacterium]|nr:hypothetical protein [Bacteroidota bacterium]
STARSTDMKTMQRLTPAFLLLSAFVFTACTTTAHSSEACPETGNTDVALSRTPALSLTYHGDDFPGTPPSGSMQAEDTPPRSLYFSFYHAPPPSDAAISARVYQGFARSDDRGEQWHNLGWLTSAVIGFDIDEENDRIVLATDYGVLGSKNDGESWKLLSDWRMPPVLAVRLQDDGIWTATAAGIFLSTDQGKNWEERGKELPAPDGNYVADLLFTSDALLAATADGIFRSTDEGKSWRRSGLRGEAVFRLVAHPSDDTHIIAIMENDGIRISEDGGRLWENRSETLPSKLVKTAAFDPSDVRYLLVGTQNSGVLRSTNGGQHWELSSGGMTNFHVTAIQFDPDMPDRVYAGVENGSFVSDNRGKTWRAFSIRLGYVSAIAIQ